MTADPPPRKRSNSLPIPKIEVTTCRGGFGDQKKLGSDLSSDNQPCVKRTSSMSTASPSRKKSWGCPENNNPQSHHSGGTGFKTFKTFVQSKILSKSDRSLATTTTSNNGNEPEVGKKTANGNGALSARDHFMRRSSRTSFTEIDMVEPKKAVKKVLSYTLFCWYFQLTTTLDPNNTHQKKKAYATTEDPNTELSDSMRLVKGKSMPSLR